MRLELAERLRCPRPHEPSPLVLVAQEVVERELRRGLAGCPVCGAEVRVRDGDVHFDALGVLDGAARHAPESADPTQYARAERERLDRLIALLGVGEPEGTVLLTGGFTRFAAAISRETGVSIVVTHTTNAADRGGPDADVSAVWIAAPVVPLSDHTFRAAAVDSLDAALLADAARTVVVGGRLVAPAAAALPMVLRELARDAEEWVAERAAGSGGVVPLRRA